MSHFSVAVITKGKPCNGEIEEILRPYCECYEEGWNDEYFTFEPADEEDEESEGYYYNPDARWDWFSIGGRWAGLIRTKKKEDVEVHSESSWIWKNDRDPYESKEEGIFKVDCCRIKDIITTDENEYKKGLRFWELVVEGQAPQTEDEEEIKKFCIYKPEYYLQAYKTKENYAKARSQFSTYAVVKDGEWYEAGRMGWWGISSAEPEDEANWENEYFDLVFAEAEEDEYLTIVDCHI